MKPESNEDPSNHLITYSYGNFTGNSTGNSTSVVVEAEIETILGVIYNNFDMIFSMMTLLSLILVAWFMITLSVYVSNE